MTSRCLFMTSSYWTTCLRMSKLWPSTLVCALSIDLVITPCSIGTSSSMPSRSIMLDDAVGAEAAHQLVFERDVELRRARVALAAGAAAQLVVDAAGLVPLGADDVQAAGVRHARTEHDVGAAAGHVGRDRHRPRLARLGDDRRFALVLLGVEHLVLRCLRASA